MATFGIMLALNAISILLGRISFDTGRIGRFFSNFAVVGTITILLYYAMAICLGSLVHLSILVPFLVVIFGAALGYYPFCVFSVHFAGLLAGTRFVRNRPNICDKALGAEKQGNYELAEKIYTRMLTLSKKSEQDFKENGIVHLAYGNFLENRKRYDDALQQWHLSIMSKGLTSDQQAVTVVRMATVITCNEDIASLGQAINMLEGFSQSYSVYRESQAIKALIAKYKQKLRVLQKTLAESDSQNMFDANNAIDADDESEYETDEYAPWRHRHYNK